MTSHPWIIAGHINRIAIYTYARGRAICTNPEGYRKALRLFQHAEKFKMPVLTVVDTPGAYPGIAGEQHGIGQAIAYNIRELARLRVPVVSVVTGEGYYQHQSNVLHQKA